MRWRCKRPTPPPPAFESPGLFDATESEAKDQQTCFYWGRGGEFAALIVAAAAGMVPGTWLRGAGPIVAVLAFAVALVIRLSGAGDRAEKRWYDARAAAESIKSAAWQYTMCGESYRHDDTTADQRFKDFLKKVLKAVPKLEVPAKPDEAALTDDMKALRAKPLSERKAVYREGRVMDQLSWYSNKAMDNKTHARQWTVILIGIEAMAVILGALRIADAFDVDWLSLFAAIAASVAAWKQTKNFTFLSEAYSVTSHEVEIIHADLDGATNEKKWAQFVHDAEAAFSREHTLWVARRQGPLVNERRA